MEQALVSLVVERINERFQNEAEFYAKLNISQENWEAWKLGKYLLNEHELSAIIMLFSDYEWMLVQKVLRNTRIIPEKHQTAVPDFAKMKFTIAKKWMQSDLANVELVERLQEDEKLAKTIEVRVVMGYDSWGYNDILTFTFPAIERERVSGSKRELIQYMTETYEESGEVV